MKAYPIEAIKSQWLSLWSTGKSGYAHEDLMNLSEEKIKREKQALARLSASSGKEPGSSFRKASTETNFKWVISEPTGLKALIGAVLSCSQYFITH